MTIFKTHSNSKFWGLKKIFPQDLSKNQILLKRITFDPKVHSTAPTIRNMRFKVSHLLELLAGDMKNEEILEDYPFIEMEDIKACLKDASMISNIKSIRTLSAI